jgi:succinate dehydrogenase/fumarate reductase flavoprotein subunit
MTMSSPWPYPVLYGRERKFETDVLVLGGGIAGCWAAIGAAKKGARVVMVEKAATIRSGSGGSGCDHWHFAIESPLCPLSPEEFAHALVDNHKGYNNGIARYIQCRDSYDTLLELEQMGAKVRDTEDEFKGAEFRDERTKLLFTYDYVNKYTLRVWGTTFKPVLFQECRRLGVQIFDRTMATRLLVEEASSGRRVVGAMGIQTRTGEMFVCSSRATVLCLSYPGRQWIFSSELTGLASFTPPANAGDGHAMAWEAGAEMVMMERSVAGVNGTDGGNAIPSYMMGTHTNTWYPCSLVDAEGREIPWIDRDGRVLNTIRERCRPSQGQKFFLMGGGVAPFPHPGVYEYMPPGPVPLKKLVEEGKITLPVYADLPGMPELERRVIFGMMVGQEAKTQVPVLQTLTRAGFDRDKDLLQSYHLIGLSDWVRGPAPGSWRRFGVNPGGPLVDWDLRTSLEGLYAAGDQLFGGNDHSHAATTGRWAGRRAAGYALGTSPGGLDEKQVNEERKRIYAPVKRGGGMDWRELCAGISKVMQDYCGETRNEELLNLGLRTFAEIREREAREVTAGNPHELVHVLEAFSMISVGEAAMHASLARRASSETLHFRRSDYPQMDPPEWNKFVTVRKQGADVLAGERPFHFWLPFEDNYQRHHS